MPVEGTLNEESTAEETPVEDNSDCPLNNAEIIFVSTLISGGDYDAKARENGSMTSVLADSVNEKLFDIIGDTAIVFEGDIPVILEDYIDDVKEIVHIKEN